MALLLREQDVLNLVGIGDALEATELALRGIATGEAKNQPRQRVSAPPATLHLLAAAVPTLDALGFKVYSAVPGRARFAVWLYRQSTGELLAIIEADWLGRLRTGAASGVATKYLAREDAQTLGVFGSGGQAQTQIEAVASVRTLTTVLVYSRTSDPLVDFCSRMTAKLNVPVRPAPPEEVARQEIVCTITTSNRPVLKGAWIQEGSHINAAGANWAAKRELDDDVLRRATIITCDDPVQAGFEAGDLIEPIQAKVISWDQVHPLGEVLIGRLKGRKVGTDITLFKSLGIGAEDVAFAARIYDRAVAGNVGERVNILE
ncbi:MAG: ornithine cyclodeaminase [Chloroflexi bacterium]|nr:ornithine cyclodeaminase [Chloroflexota bacterium]